MLNRHPAIAICRETEFFHWVYKRRWTFGSLSDPGNRQRVVKQYLATQRMQRMRLDLEALGATLLQEATSYFPAQKWILQKRVSSERLPRTAKSPAG